MGSMGTCKVNKSEKLQRCSIHCSRACAGKRDLNRYPELLAQFDFVASFIKHYAHRFIALQELLLTFVDALDGEFGKTWN